MKKLLVLLLALISITMAAQNNSGWEEWQKTSCYSNISFRLKYEKKNGAQHIWKIQFRNDYSELISFNYHLTDKLGQYNLTTHRKTMNAQQVSDAIEIYTREEDIFLIIDKLSFSPYPENFEECDSTQ